MPGYAWICLNLPEWLLFYIYPFVNMAGGINEVSLVEFIPKERNYLEGITNKNLKKYRKFRFLDDIDAVNKLLITWKFDHTKIKSLNFFHHEKYFW